MAVLVSLEVNPVPIGLQLGGPRNRCGGFEGLKGGGDKFSLLPDSNLLFFGRLSRSFDRVT